jgi:hypothetical protein
LEIFHYVILCQKRVLVLKFLFHWRIDTCQNYTRREVWKILAGIILLSTCYWLLKIIIIYIFQKSIAYWIRWFIYILGKILIHTFFGWIHTLSSCVRLYADLIWVCLPHPPMFIWLRNLYYTIFSKYIIILLIPFHLDIRGVGQTHSNLICI